MAMIELSPDFKEFLRLLNAHQVEYLLIGGYAVGFHGHPRATGDLDIWVGTDDANAQRVVRVIREFGFDDNQLTDALVAQPGHIIRMGVPPVRIEVLNSISGVSFKECLARSVPADLDGVPLRMIGLSDLRINKLQSGRPKDLADLEELPPA